MWTYDYEIKNREKRNKQRREYWSRARKKVDFVRYGLSVKILGRSEYNRQYWRLKNKNPKPIGRPQNAI